MTESFKTAVFFALAVVCIAAAYLSRPVITDVKMDEMVGKVLFPNFTDPLAVKKLEIIRPNAAGEIERFEIAEVNGIWSIPSHENYPADAKEQMGRLTEALVGLKVLALAPNIASAPDPAPLYTLYGVVEPSSDNNSVPEGAGVKVRLAGENDTTLAELIIGKETKQKEATDADTPPGSEENLIRYIRVVGQTPVYEAAIDLSRFSTSFDQWIEKNLLDVSSYDVKEVFVDEYSLKIDSVLTQQGIRSRIAPNFSGDILLGYDGSKTGAEKWNLSKWMKTQGETFDYTEQKLSADQELNTDILDSMLTALNDLKIVDVSKKPNILAAALRDGKPLEKIEDDTSLQRSGFYLVSMPDLKGDKKKTIQQMLSNEGNLQIRMKDGIRYTLRFGDLTGTESEIAADDAKKEESKDKVEPAKEVKMGENRYLFITADFDETTVAKPDLKPVPELPKEGTDEVKKKAEAEKEQLEKTNQREKDRYNEAVEAGKKRAKKLTYRFADWYYVIPEDVYKKIHLTDANVFRAKKKEDKANPAHGEPGHVHTEGDEHHSETPAKPAVKPELPTLPGMEPQKK